jgi:hypothetical protein
MKFVKPGRRMTLREMLTHTEKCNRDLVEHFHGDLIRNLVDYRDLTRPVRRRSHYPTLIALQNALQKLEETSEEALMVTSYLLEQMQEILSSAKKEQNSPIR